MPSLYKVTAERLELEHILRRLEEEGEDYGGASDDIVEFLVTAKEEELAQKVDGYVHVVRGIESSVKARKKEMQHLKNMNRAEANTVKRLKEAAKWASQQLDRPKLRGNAHTITVSTTKKPAAIDVLDEEAVPMRWKRHPSTWIIEKKAILEHFLETGEVLPGVEVRRVTKVMMR